MVSSHIRSHFERVDPILFSVIQRIDLDVRGKERPSEYFASLCRQIIGQQLSGSVADVIYARFERVFPKKRITPHTLLTVPDEKLRGTGMSGAKVKFLRDLAQRIENKEIDLQCLQKLSDEEVIATLTRIKGIGPWTAEMFCMFTLGRPDVFSFGDLGLKRAIQKLYALPGEPTIHQMTKLSKRWKPYRTYAALALWKFKDG